jgi:hypothetical protein
MAAALSDLLRDAALGHTRIHCGDCTRQVALGQELLRGCNLAALALHLSLGQSHGAAMLGQTDQMRAVPVCHRAADTLPVNGLALQDLAVWRDDAAGIGLGSGQAGTKVGELLFEQICIDLAQRTQEGCLARDACEVGQHAT